MEHRPYPKIPKQHDGSRPPLSGSWVATEKIHGANLVVATDGTHDEVGKRKAWLAHDEPFFGWQLLRSDLGAIVMSRSGRSPSSTMRASTRACRSTPARCSM